MRKYLFLVASLIAIGAVTDSGPLMLGGGKAEAIIGRPLTPMSYAGVARRTTRRAVYAGGGYGYGYGYGGYYGGGGAYAAPVVQTTAVVQTLPSGCGQVATAGGVYYQCGGGRYEPYYSGGTVVYRHY